MHKFQFLGLQVRPKSARTQHNMRCNSFRPTFSHGVQGPIKMKSPDLILRVIVADSSENNGLPGEVIISHCCQTTNLSC